MVTDDGPPLVYGEDFTLGETRHWCWVCTRMLTSTEHDDRQARGCGAHCTEEAR